MRATAATFKGIELYSWKEAKTGGWRFALLPGTNRNKFPDEILNATEIFDSVETLEQRISQLAPSEHISWGGLQDDDRFLLPPQPTRARIVEHARKLEITIFVSAND
jgi:hypothetical protein